MRERKPCDDGRAPDRRAVERDDVTDHADVDRDHHQDVEAAATEAAEPAAFKAAEGIVRSR